jgi:DNA-binding CsgD family transcriptional regulator
VDLLERDGCLADLAGWLDAALQLDGRVALLAGEAGIGKTSLLRRFSKQQDKVRVLWGACDALFTPRPLAPLHDVAAQTQGALLAVLHSPANLNAVFAATLDEVSRTRTLLVFEDMHWADEATLDLLTYLGRRMHRTRSMLVASYRDDELSLSHPLRAVIGGMPREATLRMTLAPLSEAAVTRLAKQAGRPPRDLHRITGGNPLFVTEVLAAAGDRVPVTVRDAVLTRVARLSPQARAVADLVCVVPGRTEPWLLGQTVRPDEAVVDSCLSAGMVRHDDGSLAFRHELVRRALEDSLPRPRRLKLHAQVLEALAGAAETPTARIAYHAVGADDGSKVLHYAPLAAAEAAAIGAHREAALHYEAALRHAQGLPAGERAGLQQLLVGECHLTGTYARGIEVQQAALETWRELGEPLKQGDALRWLSKLNWYCGDTSQAVRYSVDSIALLESLPAGPELAAAYLNRADLHLEAHEADSAIAASRRAISLAEQLDSTETLADAINALGTMRLITGDVSGWADLNRSLQLALGRGLQKQVASSYTNLAAMAVSRRQYAQAADYLQTGLAYAEERDLDFCRPYMLAYRARLRFEQGEWNAASEDVDAVLRDPHTTAVTRIPALRTLAHLRVRRGDPDVAGPVREARALAGPTPLPQRSGMLALVCAEAAWLANDREGVIREALPVYELTRHRHDPRMNGELAMWLYRVGALEESATDVAEPYATEMSGDWHGAASAWQALGCHYEQACLLGQHGAEDEQRQALAILERLGAAPAAQRLRQQMRARGVRRIPRGLRTSTRGHPQGLTRREAEILQLLADGLRSSAIAKRLFLSPKTVEHHISAVLAKLRVSSRAEAVALAHRRAEED